MYEMPGCMDLGSKYSTDYLCIPNDSHRVLAYLVQPLVDARHLPLMPLFTAAAHRLYNLAPSQSPERDAWGERFCTLQWKATAK